jgi:ubiquinol-cytochrome c reductase cytochrome b subunit
VASSVFLLIAAFVIFFAPTFGGIVLEPENFIAANPLETPAHIKPVWYFTPYYAMLRVVPHKLAGVLVMFAAILVLFLVPWLDRGVVRSIRYKGAGYKIALVLFVVSFVLLGAVGAGVSTVWIPRLLGRSVDVTSIENGFGRLWMVVYFGFFAFLRVYTHFGLERARSVPGRVTRRG